MKKIYIIATPSGRSIISIRDDPRKAFFKTMKDAKAEIKTPQKYFKVKLKVKSLRISDKVYNQHF